MSEINPPVVVCEGNDLTAFKRLEDVESHIEAYDVASHEFFDSRGQRLLATADGYRVELHPDPEATPEPERLETLIRSYFSRLGTRRPRFADYASAADHAASLHELLDLRLKLSDEQRYGFWSGVRQRLIGHKSSD
ncbi:MAG TPA: hypothetical protein VGO14_02665 [Solirubrobacteraceae bacterium]|jgi:hypothetical protein|nr:hypothetical protein [Solirubrobacteraceae bacterium]